MKRAKIFATLGPASNNETVLRKMFDAGLDGVRLNFSHGSHAEHIKRIKMVRDLNGKTRRSVKIMQDLEGFRIRVGKLAKPIELKKGRKLELTQEDITGDKNIVPFDYSGSLKKIKPGTLIYIDDGKIVFEVRARSKKSLEVRIRTDGLLKENKGINFPDVKLDFPASTAKDRRDLKISLRYKLDCVAQSFVRNAGDIQSLKRAIKPKHPDCVIFAKIENRQALENIDEIIDEADAVMVARGDLGVCIPIYKVPVIQKEIMKKCILKGKPVMVATQMLESMTEERIPTRAEVCDVANAIIDGANHLLLSGETAIGKHPHRVVDMMDKIIKNTEEYEHKLKGLME